MATTSTPTPDQLVQQWSRKLHRVAYDTGVDYDDVRQTAWLLAAETIAKDGDVEIGKWHSAVHVQVLTQRDGVNRYADDEPGPYIGSAWLAGSGGDDPCDELQAAEDLAQRVGGAGREGDKWQRIRQEIDLPRTAAEIAGATGCSARHGRRLAAELRELERVQADLFSADESGEDE